MLRVIGIAGYIGVERLVIENHMKKKGNEMDTGMIWGVLALGRGRYTTKHQCYPQSCLQEVIRYHSVTWSFATYSLLISLSLWLNNILLQKPACAP